MGYGSLVSLVFHNLPSLYPSSFCRNDFSYFHTYKYQPVRLHLTELSDDVSLCAYLVEYYLSAFYKTIIIAMIKKQ